jgi:ABC-type transport system involved in multi-copper enzyme maturation permease subunit
MNKVIAIARREVQERSFIFVAATVVMLAPLLALAVPRGQFSERLGAFAVLSLIVAVNFPIALSAILGASLISRDLTEKRMSFYFSRPVSASAIWFGKLAAGIALIVGTTAITIIPSLFVFKNLSISGWDLQGLAGFVIVASVLALLLSHTISMMIRSRSPLLAFDVAALIVFIIALGSALTPLMLRHARFLTAAVVLAVLLAFVVTVVAGGVRQLSRGRIDLKRNHAELSRFVWISAAITLVVVAGFMVWVKSVAPRDLREHYEFHAPAGSWFWTGGEARHRIDYGGAFLVDSMTGQAIEVPLQFEWFGSFNRDGSAAAWAEPTNPVAYFFAKLFSRGDRESLSLEILMTRLDANAKPMRSGILLNGLPSDLEVTPDLSRVAVIAGDSLTVYDVPSRKSLGSVRLGEGRHSVTFATPNAVRIVTVARQGRDVWAIRARAFDTTRRAMTTLLDVTTQGSFGTIVSANTSNDGRVLVARTKPGNGPNPAPVYRFFDLTTGRETAAISPASGETLGWSCILRDGRVAISVSTKEKTLIRLYANGALQREMSLDKPSIARFDGELPNGNLLISRGSSERNLREALVVDIERGQVISRASGIVSVVSQDWFILPSSAAQTHPIYRDVNGNVVTWNPATNEQKRVL